tara:strand:+ start:372 stop:866 length:495 start_codon:yes stop_codon:yes gene_type:complete
MIKKINLFLIKTNRPFFLILIVVFGILLNVSISLLVYYFLETSFGEENETALFSSKILEYILVVFIAPLTETAIFQYLLIVFILKNFSYKNKQIQITFLMIISSLLFALIHLYSFYYFIMAFIMGVYFGYITLLSEFFREKKINVFISVFLTHSMINLVAMIFD